jgi:hypothetical protein
MPKKAYEYYNGSRLIADYVGKVALDDVAVSKQTHIITYHTHGKITKTKDARMKEIVNHSGTEYIDQWYNKL